MKKIYLLVHVAECFLKAQGHLVFVLLKRKQGMVVDRCFYLLETKGTTKTFWSSFIGRHFDSEVSVKIVSLIKIVK